MKKIIYSLLVVILLGCVACQPVQTQPTQDLASETYPPLSSDVSDEPTTTPQKNPTTIPNSIPESTLLEPVNEVEIKYAQNFTMEYIGNYKVLTVTQPWAGAEEAFTYFLIPRGSEAPQDAGDAMVIEVPVRSFVSMSTTYYPFLENIGKLDTLVGVDDAMYAYNETVRERAEAGDLTIVGGGAGGGSVNVETLLDLDPDLIMTSASGSPELDAHPKLLEAGLPVVLNADYLEQSPLGRAEWGIFIAAFYDLEEEASLQFDALVERYEAARNLTANITEKVTVFTNTDYQGTWYMPGGESYIGLLLRDAGAQYLWADQPGTGAMPLSFETVFDQARDADYWINVGFPTDLASLLVMDSRYAEFDAVENAKVYNYNLRVNPNGGVDYYESGVANPDLILKDLIKIFYPELLPEYELFYYQQLK
ncbi:MAG: ABC transporter substrate-binding protein [Anaerolineaceae bacterium]